MCSSVPEHPSTLCSVHSGGGARRHGARSSHSDEPGTYLAPLIASEVHRAGGAGGDSESAQA